MSALRLPTGVAIVLVALALAACGGGGGNPGTCQGSPQVCFGSDSGPSAPSTGSTGGVVGLFSTAGVGDATFQLPATVTQVHIQASFTGAAQNFVVKIGGSPVVNAVVGTAQNPPAFSGTFQVTGGSLVEISGSTGVSWQITEVRG